MRSVVPRTQPGSGHRFSFLVLGGGGAAWLVVALLGIIGIIILIPITMLATQQFRPAIWGMDPVTGSRTWFPGWPTWVLSAWSVCIPAAVMGLTLSRLFTLGMRRNLFRLRQNSAR